MPSVVTANDLRSGAVVYLTVEGRWVAALSEASIAENDEQLKAFEGLARAAVERNEVTAVYAFEARLADGRPEPISVRERIRAAQPAPI